MVKFFMCKFTTCVGSCRNLCSTFNLIWLRRNCMSTWREYGTLNLIAFNGEHPHLQVIIFSSACLALHTRRALALNLFSDTRMTCHGLCCYAGWRWRWSAGPFNYVAGRNPYNLAESVTMLFVLDCLHVRDWT